MAMPSSKGVTPETSRIHMGDIMTEYTESFEKVPLFEGLAPTEIQDLLKIAEDIEAKKSDTVVLQDTPGDGFYIISAGALEVLKSGNRNEVVGRLAVHAQLVGGEQGDDRGSRPPGERGVEREV